jgi:hypothetical protein
MNAELSPFAARMLGALQSLTAKNEPHPCGGFTTDDMQWKMGVAFTGWEELTAAIDELTAAGLIQYAGDDENDAIGDCYELVLAEEAEPTLAAQSSGPSTIPGVETALDAIEQKTAEASTPEASGGWRHAGLVVRLFKDVRRALLQLRHHAGFTSSPDKAAAYREAAAILSQHTGVSLIEPETVSPTPREPELFQLQPA